MSVRDRMVRLLGELSQAWPPPMSPAVYREPVKGVLVKRPKRKKIPNQKYTELSKDYLQISPDGTQR